MPVQLQGRLKFAKKIDRDEYIEILNEFFQDRSTDSQQGDDNAIDKLKNGLKDATNAINPSVNEQDHLFNNMQLTALLAYEATFFKIIAEKDNPEKYIDIYEKLYEEGTDFQKQLKLFENTIKKKHSIDKSVIQSNPLNSRFYAELEFQRKVSALLNTVGPQEQEGHLKNQQSNKIIILPEADEQTSISFLSNIDPQLMAYIVIQNPITVQLEKHKKIDILHEGLIGMQVLCRTFFDTSLLLLPAAALGASALVFGGLALPLTVGVALICLSAELSYYNHKNIKDNLNQGQVVAMNNELGRDISKKLQGEQVDLMPKQLWSPMQLFNVEYILKSIIEYICSSYNKHKKEFQEKIPEVANSLEDLIKYNYLEHRTDGKQRSASRVELENFKTHSKALLGVEIRVI